MPATTREQLRQDVASILFPALWVTGTTKSTGGGTATTVIVSTEVTLADGTARDANYYDNSWIHWPDVTAVLDRERLFVSVSVASGEATVTFAPTVAASPTSQQFEIHGWRPTDINTAINEFLRNQRQESLHPISIVEDAGMEDSGTTDWTAVGTTTLSKVATTGNVLFGRQALRAVNTATSSGARTASIPVRAGQRFVLAIGVRADIGTARLQAYDATNSAVIGTAITTSAEAWQIIATTFEIPATCELLQIRLIGDGATDDIYWDNLWLLDENARRVITNVTDLDYYDQVKRLEWWSPRGDSAANQTYDAMRWGMNADYAGRWEMDETQVDGLVVHLSRHPHEIGLPMLVYGRPYAALSAETDSTTAQREWVVAGACLKIIERILAAEGRSSDPRNPTRWELEEKRWQGKYRRAWRNRGLRPELVLVT